MNGTTQKVFTILLVDDNGGDVEMFLRTVEEELPREEDEQVELVLAARAEGGLAILDERRIDLVITDVRLPGMSGIELLKRIQARDRRIPVIIISWVNTVDTAVEAMRCGAFDYVTKPFEKLDLTARIHRAMRISEILFRYEPPQRSEGVQFKELVGVSPAFQNVTAMISAAARVQSTTLIIGETGTGKELIARAIHGGGLHDIF
jgi:DNA-binding NtrC family response regulator